MTKVRPDVEAGEQEPYGRSAKGRYLLFDLGRFACTGKVREIRQATESWLTIAASIIQGPAPPSKVPPGWRWEPILRRIDRKEIFVLKDAR